MFTYALVKSCWDQGGDYLDCFWPFVIKVLPTDKVYVDLDNIQRDVKDNFGLAIPLHSLKTVLYRAQQRRYIERISTRYRLMEQGLQYLDDVETKKQVERRMNALFEDIRQFLKENLDLSLDLDQIGEALLSVVYKNIEPLIQFFNPSSVAEEAVIPPQATTYLKKSLIQYIETAEETKPEHYETLRDILLGAVISTVLNAENLSKITEARAKRFKGCQVFLDTNFVFSILGLHPPEFNEPAKELFNLLKEHKFATKVFSFTVDEICKVINAYITEEYIYPTSITVDTLFSSLKRKGWTKTDAREFIMTIEDRLSALGIKIEVVEHINLTDYNPASDKLRSDITKYKPLQQPFFQNHDLAAMETIMKLRRHPVRRIENSKALFLTSDKRLSKLNFEEMGHRENGTICEAILDSLLTNIIWLKDPSARISLKSVIAVHSRDLFVKRRIWRKFYEVLRRLKQEEKVDEEAISTLFYGNFIENELRDFDETQIDEITPEFTLEEIEKAGEFAKHEEERKEKEFIQRLEEERSKVEQEKDEEWLEKLRAVRNSVQETSQKSAARLSIIYSSIATLILLCILWVLYAVLNLLWLVPVLVGGGSIGAIWSKLRQYFKRKLSKAIYQRKLKEAGLAESGSPIQEE